MVGSDEEFASLSFQPDSGTLKPREVFDIDVLFTSKRKVSRHRKCSIITTTCS